GSRGRRKSTRRAVSELSTACARANGPPGTEALPAFRLHLAADPLERGHGSSSRDSRHRLHLNAPPLRRRARSFLPFRPPERCLADSLVPASSIPPHGAPLSAPAHLGHASLALTRGRAAARRASHRQPPRAETAGLLHVSRRARRRTPPMRRRGGRR